MALNVGGSVDLTNAGATLFRPVSRQKRMNFFDLANLLDSDGNLQNEMMVFAFAATMLSTIPVLLGNEFDVNVGLKRKKRSSDDLDTSSYVFYNDGQNNYYPYGSSSVNNTSPCCKLNPSTNFMVPGDIHTEGSPSKSDNCCNTHKPEDSYQENEVELDVSIQERLYDLLSWANVKTKEKTLLPLLMNLAFERYNGNSNPADALVKHTYKSWKTFWE